MARTITYATVSLLDKYLDASQRRLIKRVAGSSTLFPVTRSFLHNDGPDVKAEFTISDNCDRVQVTMPLDVFNMLPKHTMTEEEESANA